MEINSISSSSIHLGCGDKRLPGFINIDSRASDTVDLVCDMHNLPFDSNSLDTIYMCHSLEHIKLPLIGNFLSSLKNLLKANGTLYISVPDFHVLSSLYLAKRVPLSMIVRAIHGGQEYEGNTHYFSYDFDLLTSILKSSGFSKVEYWIPEDFLPEGFTDTSTYEIGGKRISLNLKASK